jgi:hypothetical protein
LLQIVALLKKIYLQKKQNDKGYECGSSLVGINIKAKKLLQKLLTENKY